MAGSRIPAALRTQLGDEATFGLIELLDIERKDWSEQVLGSAGDKFERRLSEETRRLSEEISALRVEMRNALHDGLTAVRLELSTTRVEMLRWSFVFWIGQVATIAALLAFMLRGVR